MRLNIYQQPSGNIKKCSILSWWNKMYLRIQRTVMVRHRYSLKMAQIVLKISWRSVRLCYSVQKYNSHQRKSLDESRRRPEAIVVWTGRVRVSADRNHWRPHSRRNLRRPAGSWRRANDNYWRKSRPSSYRWSAVSDTHRQQTPQSNRRRIRSSSVDGRRSSALLCGTSSPSCVCFGTKFLSAVRWDSARQTSAVSCSARCIWTSETPSPTRPSGIWSTSVWTFSHLNTRD